MPDTSAGTITKKQPCINWLRSNRETVSKILKLWAFSRFVLALAAWYADYFQKNQVYQRHIDRGFQFTPIQSLDIWCRWDSTWYLSIVGHGYFPSATPTESYSNLAFFPLYPYLVKLFTFWLPGFLQRQSVLIFVGLLISNVCFILALFAIYELVRLHWSSTIAEKTVLLLVCLPGAYIFSAFYTESLLLMLTVCALLAAEKERWLLAAMAAALAALTRANGFLILAPVFLIYMSRRDWKLSAIKPDILAFLLVPLAVLAHFYHLYRLTGSYLAFFEAQQAWGRTVGSSFLTEFFNPLFETANQVAIVDLILISLYLLAAIIMLFKSGYRIYGIYSLLSVLVLLNSGRLFSMSRYTIVIFPVVMFLAASLKNKKLYAAVCILFAAFQVLLYTGWVNYYWIG
jgi:Gpi18-like mannosyltransferase